MTPVDDERARTRVRCERRFTESAGTVTRICDARRRRGIGSSAEASDGDGAGESDADIDERDDGGDVVARRRERVCVRRAATFVDRRGEVTRLCPSCDSDHIALD